MNQKCKKHENIYIHMKKLTIKRIFAGLGLSIIFLYSIVCLIQVDDITHSAINTFHWYSIGLMFSIIMFFIFGLIGIAYILSEMK